MDGRTKELIEEAKQHVEDLRELGRESARLRAELARLLREGRVGENRRMAGGYLQRLRSDESRAVERRKLRGL